MAADASPVPPPAGPVPLPGDPTSQVPPVPGAGSSRSGRMPDRVGAYRVLKELGRGGMGVVYLGVRDDLPQRHVAIKLIHRGMAVGQVLDRFHRERAALAALNHPNIARLLDGGTSEREEPYFVMEYIEGQPIDEYCDSRRLTIVERLRLFQRICAAVQHAHQHLVVHRDIKPRNILVSTDGQPHLLDFGIAKLLNPALGAARDAPTETGLRIMTPEYASPEQIRGEPVTTVSDVYSLGVVLFELLTGRRPYRLKTRVWQELERVICEEAPDRPSTAVTRIDPPDPHEDGTDGQTGRPPEGRTGERSPERIGLARGERPVRLRRTLEGDLDNIVLKALRKEPQRRYASAEQLSEDIQRYLDGLPVQARPDTFVYRASKFIRRHRGGVVAAGIVVAALLGGTAAATWQARIAEEERDTAQAASRRAEEARLVSERALEAVQAERARQREIARRVWLEISPRFADEGGSIAARRALVDLCTGVYAELALQVPLDDGDFWREYATGRLRSGSLLKGVRGPSADDLRRALEEYESASEQFRRLTLADPGDTASLIGWISADTFRADLLQTARGDPGSAQSLAAAAAARARELVRMDRSPAAMEAAAAAIQALGDIEFKLPPSEDAPRRAGPHWDEAASLRRELFGGDPAARDASLDAPRRLYAATLVRRAVLAQRSAPGAEGLKRADDLLAEGEALLRPMFQRDPGQPRNRRALAHLLSTRADVQRRSQRPEQARLGLEEAIDLTLPMLGDAEDFDARQNLVDQRLNLGLVLRDLGRFDESAEVLTTADADATRLLERRPNDPLQQHRAAATAMALGEVLVRSAPEAAIDPLERAVQGMRLLESTRGGFRAMLAKSLVLLCDASRSLGQTEVADEACAEAIPLLEAMLKDPALQGEPEVEDLLLRARGR